MLGVVQLVERQIVTLKVVGSKPTAHPIAMSSSEFLDSWWPPYMRRGKPPPVLWAWNWFRPGLNPK